MKVEVDKIELLREALRFELNPEETQILADDMARQGQIQPIAVKQIDGERWELVAGRRRWEAAKLLGWKEIEAFEGEYREGILIAAAAENIRRKQLSPLEESAYVEKLHTDGNMSIGAIVEATGHGTSWVQDRLAAAKLPELLKEGLHKGWFKLGAAMILSKITDLAQLEYYVHCARVSGCTAQTAEAWWLDWEARSRGNPDNSFPGTIPQPLPLPDPPPIHCFLCREKKPRVDAVVVTICIECCQEVDRAVKQSMVENMTAQTAENFSPGDDQAPPPQKRSESA